MPIFRFWRHFLALEADFAATARYVEFSKDNFKTHSIEFVKLLLAIGSEVDVVAKDVCKALEPGGKHNNIDHYRECICVRSPVYNDKVLIPQYGLIFQPWRDWYGDTNPTWWTRYNKVKHDRTNYFRAANLENCANAIAGLFAMVLYCHKAEGSQDTVEPLPRLLTWYLNYSPAAEGEPYMLPYHVYAFQEPYDKSRYPLN